MWCTVASFWSQQTHGHTHTHTHAHRYMLDTVTSRSTSADKTDRSIHLRVSAPSAPFICGWVDQADQHFSHRWPMMHLGLWRNVTGLNALICHEALAATPLYTQWHTHTHRDTHTVHSRVTCWLNKAILLQWEVAGLIPGLPVEVSLGETFDRPAQRRDIWAFKYMKAQYFWKFCFYFHIQKYKQKFI